MVERRRTARGAEQGGRGESDPTLRQDLPRRNREAPPAPPTSGQAVVEALVERPFVRLRHPPQARCQPQRRNRHRRQPLRPPPRRWARSARFSSRTAAPRRRPASSPDRRLSSSTAAALRRDGVGSPPGVASPSAPRLRAWPRQLSRWKSRIRDIWGCPPIAGSWGKWLPSTVLGQGPHSATAGGSTRSRWRTPSDRTRPGIALGATLRGTDAVLASTRRVCATHDAGPMPTR